MATHLSKSEPAKLAFRFSTLGATLQAAQDFAVELDVQFGRTEHASFREGEGSSLVAPDGSWVPGSHFVVLAERDGGVQRRRLLAVPDAERDHHLGLVIGGFTIGEDGHPDPASAWDLERAQFSVPVGEMGEVTTSVSAVAGRELLLPFQLLANASAPPSEAAEPAHPASSGSQS